MLRVEAATRLGAFTLDVARGLDRAERHRRALALLERFDVAHLADQRPRTLSGGERQRVAVARALARRPAALLLDEPLSALDTRSRAAGGRELAAVLAEAGVPTLLVTHDFTEAALLGDRVGVIDGGRVIQQGTAGELAASPASAFVADFSGAVVLTGTAHPADNGLTHVALDGGGTVFSTEPGEGPVAVSVYPWEIALAPAGTERTGSAQTTSPSGSSPSPPSATASAPASPPPSCSPPSSQTPPPTNSTSSRAHPSSPHGKRPPPACCACDPNHHPGRT